MNDFDNNNEDNKQQIGASMDQQLNIKRPSMILIMDGFGLNDSEYGNAIAQANTPALDEIFKKFYDALAPGGILFLGATEQMSNYKEVGFDRQSSFFFEKPLK